MAEKDIKECLECHLPFNALLRRKHHCHVCGKVVCWSCCQNSLADPAHPTTAKLKACNTCYVRSMVAGADGAPHLTITPPQDAAASPSSTRLAHGLRAESDDLAGQMPRLGSVNVSSGSSTPPSPSLHGPSSHSHTQHSRSVSAGTGQHSPRPSTPLAPLVSSQHPLPMPAFATNDEVSNTVASMTAMLLVEEAKAADDVDGEHGRLVALHHHPSPHRASLPLSLEVGADHPASKLHIVVPPKDVEGAAWHTIAEVSSSEPVSPSKALENHLRQNGTHPGLSPNPSSPLPPASPLPTVGRTPSASASASPSVLPPSSPLPPAVEEQVVLDLPMKLCLVILKKTAFDMKCRYSEYLKTKEARHEGEPLSFQQFMFFSTIRTLPDFLFKKTDLAYCMMREEGSQIVQRDCFVRYAPVLPPLASKLDAGAVFDVLAIDLPEGDGMVKGISLAPVQRLRGQPAEGRTSHRYRPLRTLRAPPMC